MKDFNKKLEELKGNGTNPFSVPEGDFENFPLRMQERIASKDQETWMVRILQFLKPQVALIIMFIAFAFISVTAINYILSNHKNSGVNNDMYTRIMDVDASEYTEQHFIDVLLDDDKEIVQKKEKIETDYYINYLVDDDIDYGTLIDEL